MEIVKVFDKTWYENEFGWCFSNPRKKEGLKEITASVSVAKSEDGFTMFMTEEKWGPVISGKTIEETEELFNKGFTLCLCIKSLLCFNEVKEGLKI